MRRVATPDLCLKPNELINMANTFTCLHNHAVLSTSKREPWIGPAIEARLWAYLGWQIPELRKIYRPTTRTSLGENASGGIPRDAQAAGFRSNCASIRYLARFLSRRNTAAAFHHIPGIS